MSSLSYAVLDSVTMLRRDVRHSIRFPMMTISGLVVPIILLVLFNYIFGGAIGASLGGAAHGGSYINYIAPAIVVITVGSGCASTAISVVMDMNAGIIARFRTMAISRASVLTGQVLGSLIRTTLTIIVVIGVALLLGFRPTTDPLAWIAALGLIALFTLAITWVGVMFGLIGKSPAGANSLSQLFTILAFTGTAFVSADSMPDGVRWFAQYQPFTPVVETLRGLLLGTPIGNNAMLALAWCIALTLVGYLGARATYNRNTIASNPSPLL
jgi:ABC-2 type transport system permease protein